MNRTVLQNIIRLFGYNRWPLLILYYLIVRSVIGVSYGLIYGFIVFMFILRVSVEHMLVVFFSITIVLYIFGRDVEANHYMSFVYGFMVLSLVFTAIDHFRTARNKQPKPVR